MVRRIFRGGAPWTEDVRDLPHLPGSTSPGGDAQVLGIGAVWDGDSVAVGRGKGVVWGGGETSGAGPSSSAFFHACPPRSATDEILGVRLERGSTRYLIEVLLRPSFVARFTCRYGWLGGWRAGECPTSHAPASTVHVGPSTPRVAHPLWHSCTGAWPGPAPPRKRAYGSRRPSPARTTCTGETRSGALSRTHRFPPARARVG